MPESRTSPEQKILVNGAEIAPELRVDVLESVVRQYVSGGDCFELTVNALDSADQELKWIDAAELDPGNEIEIRLGYRGELETLIAGEITALQASFPSSAAPVVKVQGFDRLHRLRRGRRTRVYREIKDSQIAERVAADFSLTPEVEDSQVVHDYVLQNNLSDVDFLLERARRIRYELIVTGRTLVFRPAANHAGATVVLEYMKDLKSFSARLSTLGQTSEVRVRGWNPDTKEPILGVARAGDETTRMAGREIGPAVAESAGFGEPRAEIVDIPVRSQAEADQIAKAKFNDMAIELVAGELEAVGNMGLKAGSTVEIRGVGERLSGTYYVHRAEHRVGPSVGYVTRAEVRRNAA